MSIRIAERWFEFKRIDDGITLIWEPHVDPLIRCNIWHVKGRERDLVIDTGMGMASLAEAAADVFDKAITAVATHYHFDHTGGLHEFADRVIHQSEAHWLEREDIFGALFASDFDAATVADFRAAGYEMPERLFEALPHEDYDPHAYAVAPAPATRTVEEGDMVDTGDRQFEVLHLPGHSPGSIGLWEAATGTLFSGDAIYNGPLLYSNDDSDLAAYIRTLERVRELPVTVVHGGHDPSFSRDRLRAIADRYLREWR